MLCVCVCDFSQAGADLDGAYGSTLTKVGQAQQKLGAAEREMIGSTFVHYVQPMRKFLDGDMKQFTREKATLDSLRLDLDTSKSRVRKARSMLGQQAVSFGLGFGGFMSIASGLVLKW